MHILDSNLKKAWHNYLLQSFLAVLALVAILYSLNILTHAAIVAALGASAFIVFAMPKSATAQPRKLIGGHIMGLIAGSICYAIFLWPQFGDGATGELLHVSAGALAVGLSILLMTVTDTGHPPAAGTALGIVAHEWSHWAVAFVLLAAVMLSLVKFLLGRWLTELV